MLCLRRQVLDNGELLKIREEFATEEDRSAATMCQVYKVAGMELAKVDERYSKTITDRTLGQKIFYKLLGLK